MAKDKEVITAKGSKRKLLKLKKKKLKGGSSNEASEINDSLSRSEHNLGVVNDKKVEEEKKVSKKAVKSKRKKQNLQLEGSPEKANTEKSSTETTHPVGNGFKDTETQSEIAASHGNEEEDTEKRIKIKKVKRKGKSTKDDVHLSQKKSGLDKHSSKTADEGVYNISSVDEDCSRGMKKWLLNYKESRPGLKILQEQIDEFIVAYEEQQEQERKEREERAAEGGWTVVVHHKGRKKTTEIESGITVGSVAQAVVLDNMTKKKSKEVPLNFYRFQKREAQRNEVMMLQQKFEQDKKRIQQLRAARKFRPY